MELLHGDETILDLGCGNGEFARELARRNHQGRYLGVDFSVPLLREAELFSESFPAQFIQWDLTKLSALSSQLSVEGGWNLVTAFAVLHHIPSTELRLEILRMAHRLLQKEGRLIHSNWQFLNSEKLKARIQPWESVGIKDAEVDAGDYLLDWRNGGEGLRYIHAFEESELKELAKASGFRIIDMFHSDGKGGDLGLYQIWKVAS